MEYTNCIAAIKKHENDPSSSNLHNDKDSCTCSRKPSPCEWVGNQTLYACLQTEHIEPQKVYSQLNSGGHGKIILPEERIQK